MATSDLQLLLLTVHGNGELTASKATVTASSLRVFFRRLSRASSTHHVPAALLALNREHHPRPGHRKAGGAMNGGPPQFGVPPHLAGGGQSHQQYAYPNNPGAYQQTAHTSQPVSFQQQPQPPQQQYAQYQPQQQQQYLHTQPPSGYQPQPAMNGGHPLNQPTMGGYNGQPGMENVNHLSDHMSGMTINRPWNQMWGTQAINLMTEKNIKSKIVPTEAKEEESGYCERDVMCCTLGKVPETASVLQKSRLPFGILLHPFKDDDEMPIIQDRSIVRCRACRTYINPFVRLLDQRRWQCNLCHRVNDLPDDFLIDMRTNRYLEYPPQQPELLYGSVEFIAPVEYMVRPPQPAAYLFVFDCSAHAFQIGYIPVMAKTILQSLDEIPGDSRTLIGFIGFDSSLHFFNLGDKQPTHLVMPDIQDVFLPYPDNLLVNLRSKRNIIEDFLTEMLPNFPSGESSEGGLKTPPVDTGSAFGSALAAAYKVVSGIGGRITVFQATLPNIGSSSDGSVLTNREDPNNRTISSTNAGSLTPLLNPVTDFYKKLALECSEHQVAVDLFSLSPSYSDLATVGQVAKVSGGSIFYYGSSTANITTDPGRILARFEADLAHYVTRSIGFEAVMRLRCTRGLSIHTFHGNFFVRSTDLLTLPNVNPDSGYAMQISIEEDLKDFSAICFQAAVLFTNARGERRIRVHTISVPVVATVSDVINGADQGAVVAMLSKMAVDRSLTSSVTDAREAALNAVIDLLAAYKLVNPTETVAGLVASHSTRLLPLYTLALLKHAAFRVGISTKVDERYIAMEKMKTLPLDHLLTYIYPDLYPVHNEIDWQNEDWPKPLQLSFANIERNGVYLLDTYDSLYLYICKSVNPLWLSDVFGVSQWGQIPDDGDNVPGSAKGAKNPAQPLVNGFGSAPSTSGPQSPSEVVPLPENENGTSASIRAFVDHLIDSRPFKPHFFVLREDSSLRYSFLQFMYDDRNESAYSYYEFLQHLQQQLKN